MQVISSDALLFETDGQDMIEYALLTTFIGFAGAAAWSAMRTSLGNAYDGFNDARVGSLGAGRSGGRWLVSVIASQWFGAFALAAAACWFDVRTRRIPNWLTFPAALLGLVAATAAHGGHGTVSSAAGFLVGLALFFPLFVLKGLGAGDVKLMGALGAWLGTSMIFGVAFYTTLAGGVLALALIVRHRYGGQAARNL